MIRVGRLNGGTEDDDSFARDYASATDPGHIGVDNAMGSLIAELDVLLASQTPECMERGIVAGCNDLTIRQSIERGKLSSRYRSLDLDDTGNDSSVQLQLHETETVGGREPNLTGAPIALRSTRLFSGAVEGDVLGRRSRFELPQLQLPVWDVEITLHDVEIRFDVNDNSLSSGVIAGAIHIDELVEAAQAIGDFDPATLRSVLGMVADLSPTSATGARESFSAAFAFAALPATLE